MKWLCPRTKLMSSGFSILTVVSSMADLLAVQGILVSVGLADEVFQFFVGLGPDDE